MALTTLIDASVTRPKHREAAILRIEVGRVVREVHEELARRAVRAPPCSAATFAMATVWMMFERSGSFASNSLCTVAKVANVRVLVRGVEAAPLQHKALHEPVEEDAVVVGIRVLVVQVVQEIGHRHRCLVVEQLDGDFRRLGFRPAA
jgi:hypothetical protein